MAQRINENTLPIINSVGTDGYVRIVGSDGVSYRITVQSLINVISGEIEADPVPTEVRNALKTLLSSAAYADIGLTDEIAIIESWAEAITAISLNTSTASISGSGTVQLIATTTPAGGTVSWSSSDPSVATVSLTGLVTSVGNGTATITASCGTLSATCTVTVTGMITLTGITATYTQTATITETSSLSDLVPDLVVVATYDDSSTATLTSDQYTLSGTLTEGTSTITVSYGGYTDTFDVTVTVATQALYDWDFTTSLTDSVSSETAVLSGSSIERTSEGVVFSAINQAITLTSEKITVSDKTYIIDIPSMTASDSGTSNHARFLMSDSSDANTSGGAGGFTYRHNFGWTIYSGSAWGTAFDSSTYPIDFFNNKRLKIYIDTDLKLTISYADMGSDSFTTIGTISTALSSTYETGYLIIGGTGNNNLKPITISAVTIYEGEV